MGRRDGATQVSADFRLELDVIASHVVHVYSVRFEKPSQHRRGGNARGFGSVRLARCPFRANWGSSNIPDLCKPDLCKPDLCKPDLC